VDAILYRSLLVCLALVVVFAVTAGAADEPVFPWSVEPTVPPSAREPLLFADDVDTCLRNDADYATISACDRLISSGAAGPDLAGAYKVRGDAFLQRREYDRAINDYDQALRIKPDYAHAFLERGRAYALKAEYDDAIADFNKAIRLEPKFVAAFDQRGNAFASKKDYDRAIRDYDAAIRLDSEYSSAFNNRGNAYLYGNNRDLDRAILDYDTAIRIHPRDAIALNNRGHAYVLKNDFDRAIQDYDMAIRFDSNFANAYANRAFAYTRKNDLAHAIQDYDTAIKLNPRHEVAIKNRQALLDRLQTSTHPQSTASEGPGKDETLQAVKQIYENQGSCLDRDWVDGNGRARMRTTIRLNTFAFSYNQSIITFSWNYSTQFSSQDYNDKDNGAFLTSFNPADVAYGLGTSKPDSRELPLAIQCSQGQACAYVSNFRKKLAYSDVPFCDGTTRDRVLRALRHLGQFYSPSKPLPF
jgi:tetratricopeptide (TPR) repeat protein